MASSKKAEIPDEANDFDVPSAPTERSVAPLVEDDKEEDVDQRGPEQKQEGEVGETPEQRRLMREKRIAKAEEEQLRRLMRQFPVIARLVQEHQTLKQQLEKRQ